MIQKEKIVYAGRPSQLVNIMSFIIWSWTIFIPIIVYLKTRFTIYEISEQRIRLKVGILSQKIDECELYRIRDYQIIKPFFLRIFGLGNLELQTSDRSNQVIRLRAVKDPEGIYDIIRNCVENRRSKTGTREVDIE